MKRAIDAACIGLGIALIVGATLAADPRPQTYAPTGEPCSVEPKPGIRDCEGPSRCSTDMDCEIRYGRDAQ